ncbi:MAG: hypothetical protein VX730_00590 [Pseudomonadota bacterium]|nr:hypothetical protein [Pseudomonadota bacterium]
MSKKGNFLQDPYFERLRDFLKESNNESDRGKALVVASLIEEMLEEILTNFMLDNKAVKKLFNVPNAPLSNLSSKTLLCRALGLINEAEFREIEIIRKIRNSFAHNVLCSFKDERIADISKSLMAGMSYVDALEKGHKSRIDEPRSRFSAASTSLVFGLYNRSTYVFRIKIAESKFPI